MVCRKSRIGRTTLDTVCDRAAQMPRGTAMTVAISTATTVSARVSIALSHWSTASTSPKPMTVPTASFHPLTSQATAANTRMIAQNGGVVNTQAATSYTAVNTVATASNRPPR